MIDNSDKITAARKCRSAWPWNAMRVAESRLLRWVDFRVEDLVVVGIFIITFGNMLRIRIGKVWEYTII